MKRLSNVLKTCLLAAGFLAAATASASLTMHTKENVLRIWGTATPEDVAVLQTRLTHAIKVVAVGDIADGRWELGRDLGALIEQAKVTTVVQGTCAGWVCSMMFLSGHERTFSATARPEAMRLEVPFIQGKADISWNNLPSTLIPDWLRQRTALKAGDLEVYHKAAWVVTPEPIVDRLVFFPATAKFSAGNALHCSGELSRERKRDYMLVDCMPMKDVTALNRRVVTTNTLFQHSFLIPKPDIATPPPSHYARIIDPVSDKLGLRDDCRMSYERFQDFDSPRAFVVSDDGHCAGASAQTRRPYDSAMSGCKKLSKTGNCRFYAVDEQVVFVPFSHPLPESKEPAGKTAD